MSEFSKAPHPQADADNAAFLDAWKEGRLIYQRARSGGRPFLYPRPICPYTGSRDLVWEEASGAGRVISFSLVMRPNHPAYHEDVPICLAEIELDEGPRLLARIVGEGRDAVTSGERVTIVPREEAGRYPLRPFVRTK